MVSRGYTLTEMLIVVVIVGLIASATTASIASADNAKLDAAAAELANLIRHARSEAIRTGRGHGISASTASQQVRSYVRGFFGIPSYTVRDPVRKDFYAIQFGTDPEVTDVTLTSVNIVFEDIGAQTLIGFNGDGVPKYETGGNLYLLENAELELGIGPRRRTVAIAATTGRVTIQ